MPTGRPVRKDYTISMVYLVEDLKLNMNIKIAYFQNKSLKLGIGKKNSVNYNKQNITICNTSFSHITT